jgi:nucleoid-associated protein EbfC
MPSSEELRLRRQRMVDRAQLVRQEIISAQESLARAEVSGTAGAGLVRVSLRGNGVLAGISIDPSVVDPDDVAGLESLIMAAFAQATEAMRTLAEERWNPVTYGIGDMVKGIGDVPR